MNMYNHQIKKMKTFYTFLLFFTLIVSFCNAQITITSASMPSSNDTIRYSNTSVAGLNYDTTGSNMTWDFSNVTPLSQGLYAYKPSLQINFAYSLFFGFSSYGLKVLDSLSLGTFAISNVYNFFQNSTSSFKAVGRGLEFTGIPIPSNYSDDDEIYQFPLHFNDYDSSTFAVSFSLTTLLDLNSAGYRINEVEGYGTVITPYGTFNCLKVKSTIVQTDTITISSFPLPPITRVTREYKWLTTTEKIPVFEISGSVFGGNFLPTTARYRDNFIVSLGNNELGFDQNQLKIYPNPASQKITISGIDLNLNDQLLISDITGKVFYQTTIKQQLNNLTVEMPELANGIYFLNIRNANGNQVKKFIKE